MLKKILLETYQSEDKLINFLNKISNLKIKISNDQWFLEKCFGTK